MGLTVSLLPYPAVFATALLVIGVGEAWLLFAVSELQRCYSWTVGSQWILDFLIFNCINFVSNDWLEANFINLLLKKKKQTQNISLLSE